jgi:hypothetical protein
MELGVGVNVTFTRLSVSYPECAHSAGHEIWAFSHCQIQCLRSSVMDNTVEPALSTWPEGLDGTFCRTNSNLGEFCRPSQEH